VEFLISSDQAEVGAGGKAVADKRSTLSGTLAGRRFRGTGRRRFHLRPAAACPAASGSPETEAGEHT